MSKRRITQQQKKRIADQKTRIQTQIDDPTLQEGLVISCFGRQVLIETTTQELLTCSFRQGLQGLVAGDKIIWQNLAENQPVVIAKIQRTSELSRPNKQNQERAVAANIQQVIIVIAPTPLVTWPLLDSYLVMCEQLGLEAVILLNKFDLPHEEVNQVLEEIYRPLGYSILRVSTHNNFGLEDFQNTLNNKISVIVGQSGVGKSSLIQKILPHEVTIRTQDISKKQALGRHTTSNARLYHLPQGGDVIDSPGVREFGLWHLSPQDISWSYREFRPYLHQCKYRNCPHYNTPGCRILTALEGGQISTSRYQNFIELLQQFSEN